MFTKVIESIFLGFAISAVPGAVLVETIRRTVLDKSSIYKFMAGNFFGIVLIVVAVFLGLAVIINVPTTANIFYGICGSLLIYLGMFSILTKHDQNHIEIHTKKRRSKYTAFSTGLFMSLVNPIRILLWISIIGKIIQDTGNNGWVIVNSLATIVGAIIFYGLLVMIINILDKKITVTHLSLLSRSFGVVLLVYGFVTLSKIVY